MSQSRPMATVGILSIGDMGSGIARLLIEYDFRVVTNASDRSEDTKERARTSSIDLLPTDKDLVEQSDYVLSIVPPRDAVTIALRMSAALKISNRKRAAPLYFLDLNAISPETTKSIVSALTETGVRILDGGIIGGPPKHNDNGWYKPSVVVSGSHKLHEAPVDGRQLSDVLNVKHISENLGPASGLKMCFAAINKGFTAVAIQSFTTAEQIGVLPELQQHLNEFFPQIAAYLEKSLTGMPPKAYRWVREMEEIGQTMKSSGGFESRDEKIVMQEGGTVEQKSEPIEMTGQGGDLFQNISEVYKFIAEDTILGKEKTGQRKVGLTAENVAKLCAERLSP